MENLAADHVINANIMATSVQSSLAFSSFLVVLQTILNLHILIQHVFIVPLFLFEEAAIMESSSHE